MDRIILHIDVNNAFLSWTAVYMLKKGYKYDIRNRYAIIAGDESQRRGIVLAKSNPCKKNGVVTAEAIYSARRKCPYLEIYKPNYKLYKYFSDKMYNYLCQYTDIIERYSIDECFLDYTGSMELFGDPVKIAYKIKDDIYRMYGFTVNVGVGNNKLLAKMASDFSKPYKVHTLYDFEVEKKMHPLNIGELFGVGKKTAPKLEKLGIKTIGDLAHYDLEKLTKYFKNQAIYLNRIARGIDNSEVISEVVDPTSIGNEITLTHDATDYSELCKYLLAISDSVALRLRKQNKYANVIVVVLKDNFFKRKSHQKKIMNAINTSEDIYMVARQVLKEMWTDYPVRLIGIRLDKLTDKVNFQTSLFDDYNTKKESEQVEKTIDKLKEKFGRKIIKKASMIETKINRKYD